MKLVAVLVVTLLLFYLVRRKLLHVDFSLPWLLAIIVLGFASLSEGFVSWVARLLGIVDPPLAVILISLFLVLGLTTFLAVALSRLRYRQISLVRHLAQMELSSQEKKIAPNHPD